MKNNYYGYSVCGLSVHSEIELPELLPVEGLQPDLTIIEGKVPENLERSISSSLLFQYSDDAYLYKSRNSGKFLLTNDDRLIFERYGRSSYEDIRALLLGILLGIVLHAKNRFPLHASAVDVGGRAILFSGPCGSGKSTLAAAFLKRGFDLISDDITVITLDGQTLFAIPSYPQIKLWDDSIKALGYAPCDFQTLRPRVQKKRMSLKTMSLNPVPLSSVYFFKTANVSEVTIDHSPLYEAIRLIDSNTYRGRLFKGIVNPQNHFSVSCALSDQARIRTLARPAGLFEPDALVETIINDLNGSMH